VTNLRNAIASVDAIYDPWKTTGVTLEQFFADVYYMVAADEARALSVFVELSVLYRRMLAATTNWFPRGPRLGALDRLLRQEIPRSTDGLTVITFNHDLALEHAAARLPRSSQSWCLRGLYGDISLQPLHWSGSAFRNHRANCPHDPPPFKLLKLHGSMNWFLRSTTRNPTIGTLFPRERTQRGVYVGDHKDILIFPVESKRARPGGRRWYLWPLIVPPIYDKQRITGMTLLQEVWDQATAAIARADRLVMLGYSLPDADVLARQTLRTAVRQNASLECVECINPDAAVVEKLQQTLDLAVTRLFTNTDAYLRNAG
jgi:hypothetical protein